jgi:5-(carboxyamino)imidazole ribonucleotide synthase
MTTLTPLRIGILGGGQLARMLAEQAYRLGLSVVVYAEERDSPAAQVCRDARFGALNDRDALAAFFRNVDVVAFENEFVDTSLLRECAAEARVTFVPSLETIATLQDKLNQKRILTDANVPTARYIVVEPGEGDAAFIERAFAMSPRGVVFKWSRMGYDGHGVFIARTPDPSLESFFERGRARGGEIYAEEAVDFVRELAMVMTVSRDGADSIAYPLVVSRQERGICREVRGPARLFGVAAQLEDAARDACARVAAATNLGGTFALEFFETAGGALLVNEIAPRVHNTGHYSQNACSASQFENHIRAVAALPLAAIHSAPAFAMYNILGPDAMDRAAEGTAPPLPGPGTHVHWYGKSRIKPWRKLGHVNAVAGSAAEIEERIEEMHAIELAWSDSIRDAGGNE